MGVKIRGESVFAGAGRIEHPDGEESFGIDRQEPSSPADFETVGFGDLALLGVTPMPEPFSELWLFGAGAAFWLSRRERFAS